MGYTHYWYTQPELDKQAFKHVGDDFTKMIPTLEHLGMRLGNGIGEGQPVITDLAICFNGLAQCGHTKEHIGLAWPTQDAKGITPQYMRKRQDQPINGHWFAGVTLSTRVCGGDCSYETFSLEQSKQLQVYQKDDIDQTGYTFDCCKTNFKPYDLAVNVCLVIAKHYLKDQIKVLSDGDLEQWQDAIQLCDHFLGYGSDFSLDERPEPKPKRDPQIQTTQNNDLKPGDVFESYWGYDQTNIDYYKVVRVSPTKKTCTIMRIQSKRLEARDLMSEKVAPDPSKPYLDKIWNDAKPNERPEYTEVITEYRATVRYDRKDGKLYLICGKLPGSSYLSVYTSPGIATHYH